MKLIVRMIREIFRMLNQYAVDIPTRRWGLRTNPTPTQMEKTGDNIYFLDRVTRILGGSEPEVHPKRDKRSWFGRSRTRDDSECEHEPLIRKGGVYFVKVQTVNACVRADGFSEN